MHLRSMQEVVFRWKKEIIDLPPRSCPRRVYEQPHGFAQRHLPGTRRAGGAVTSVATARKTYLAPHMAAKLAANLAAMSSAPMRCGYAAIPIRAPRTQPAEPSFLYVESRLVMLSATRMRRARTAPIQPRTLPACPDAVFPLGQRMSAGVKLV